MADVVMKHRDPASPLGDLRLRRVALPAQPLDLRQAFLHGGIGILDLGLDPLDLRLQLVIIMPTDRDLVLLIGEMPL